MAFLTNLRTRAASQNRERGAVLVLTALVMMLLLFIAAFATDLGAWYRQGQEQQRAADVGALNGVQAYDRGTKAYMSSIGASLWTDLTDAEALEAEEAGLREAANTIIALMETTGLTFTDAGVGALASDPRDVNQTSVWTVMATDGTEILITRSFVQTGVDTSNNPTYSRAIDVEVIAPGEQYFSNVVRDAPQIERSASSVLSNCGAICNSNVTLNPPFAGFGASGEGDGLKPLLKFTTDINNQQVLSEIWAVNHHAKTSGSIVCMNAETEQPCDSATHYPLKRSANLFYQTGTWNEDYLDPATGKLYFAAKAFDSDDTTTDRTGIVCFDTNTRDYCSGTEFVGLFNMTRGASGPGTININGPIRHGSNLYVFAQNGQMGCVTVAMVACTTAVRDTPAVGTGAMRGLGAATRQIGLAQNGTTVYVAQYVGRTAGAHVFYCVDLANLSANCMTPQFTDGLASGTNAPPNVFFEYNATGGIEGVCVYQKSSASSIDCFTLGGADRTNPAGLGNFLDNNEGGSYGGQSFTWLNKRTFWATGGSNKVMCWDWSVGGGGQQCADLAVLNTNAAYATTQAPSAPKRGDGIEPYGFAQVTEGCLIGLGDSSIFFSFGPEGMGPCVDSTLRTLVEPCDCADGSTRWGEIILPADLMAQVVTLNATVTRDKGPNQPAIHADLSNVPLHTLDGRLDLGVLNELNNVPDEVWLELTLSAKLIDGKPAWTTPRNVNLEISVQPTLTS